MNENQINEALETVAGHAVTPELDTAIKEEIAEGTPTIATETSIA